MLLINTEEYSILKTVMEQLDRYDPIVVGLSGQVKEFREEEYANLILRQGRRAGRFSRGNQKVLYPNGQRSKKRISPGGEYTHSLCVTSELVDLREEYANLILRQGRRAGRFSAGNQKVLYPNGQRSKKRISPGGEYTHSLCLTSELVDLREEYANLILRQRAQSRSIQ